MLTPIQRIEIVATVKEALGRNVTVEDVILVEQGNFSESHPVSALINSLIRKLATDRTSPTTEKPEIEVVISKSNLTEDQFQSFHVYLMAYSKTYGITVNLVNTLG